MATENKRPAIRVMVNSPVKKSVSNLDFGCCSKLKSETKLIALSKRSPKHCGCQYKSSVATDLVLYITHTVSHWLTIN